MAKRVAAIGLLLLIVGSILTPIAAGSTSHVGDRQLDAGAVPTDSAQSPLAVTSASDQSTSPALFSVKASDFDRTVFSIEVYENASARWTFQYTRNLVNDTEQSSFEAFASDFNENETALYTNFVEQATALTESGTNVTGRSMNASAFSRSARVTPLGNRGIVEMSFTWSQFGQQDGDRVIVSDVFQGGLYIRSDQRLQFVTGPGLAFETVDPLPSNVSGETLAQRDSISWLGERTFSDRRPLVAFQPASAMTTIDDGTTTTDGDDTTTADPGTDTTTVDDTDQTTTTIAGSGGSGGLGLPLVLAALAFIAIGVVTAAWANGYFEPDDGDVAAEGGGPDSPPPDGSAGAAGGSVVESTDLLTDDDRVIQLLEERGGRMKQTEIVDATDWSKSKVSMLLSDMEDAEEITKLRVGRENIISLPGAEPEAARSPFEDIDE